MTEFHYFSIDEMSLVYYSVLRVFNANVNLLVFVLSIGFITLVSDIMELLHC